MPFPITPDAPVTHVPLAPGGTLRIRGAWSFASQNITVDGCQSGAADGAPTGGGAFDYAQGGFQLRARDWAGHTCVLVARSEPGAACAAAGVASPCLPSRLPSLAHQLPVPVSVQDFRDGLTGAMELEPLTPAAAAVYEPPLPPSFLERHATTLGSGVAVTAALLLGGWYAARRRQRPEAQVQRAAARVRVRLDRAEPVYRALAPRVQALVAQSGELAALRDRLRTRVASVDRSALLARRATLAVGTPEGIEARALVDAQIARLDGWEREVERASARIDRVLETLRSLEMTLEDERAQREVSERAAQDARALSALSEEIELSRASAEEAERVR